ncbi:hypothetical protein ANO11243_066710 [Dothideomycetidae sp. 11243]|nr:hypothetical protein ANO11243_066710 [fungal sp. No.11243]
MDAIPSLQIIFNFPSCWRCTPMDSPTQFRGWTHQNVSLLTLAVILTFISTTLYILRALTNRTDNHGRLRADFIWVTIALVCNLVTFAFVERSIYYGIGQHISYLSEEQIVQIIFWSTFFIICGLITSTFGKLSITAILISFENVSRSRRYVLWAVGCLQVAITVPCIFMMLFSCWPVSKNWNPFEDGTCSFLNVSADLGMAQGAVSAFVDFFLSLWPLTLMSGLKMPLRVKVGFCLLMGLATITGIVAVYRVVISQTTIFDPDLSCRSRGRTQDLCILTDLTTDAYAKLFMCCLVELNGIIIFGTIPTLRPLVRRLFGVDSSLSGGWQMPEPELATIVVPGMDTMPAKSQEKPTREFGSAYLTTVYIDGIDVPDSRKNAKG